MNHNDPSKDLIRAQLTKLSEVVRQRPKIAPEYCSHPVPGFEIGATLKLLADAWLDLETRVRLNEEVITPDVEKWPDEIGFWLGARVETKDVTIVQGCAGTMQLPARHRGYCKSFEMDRAGTILCKVEFDNGWYWAQPHLLRKVQKHLKTKIDSADRPE